ncbi:MAG: hypothetical protein WED09_05245 [Homoserinimonas sp.]
MSEHVDGFATYYLSKWRRLTETERRAMRNLRSVEFMAEAFAEYYPEEGTMPRVRKATTTQPETWQEREIREATEALGRMLDESDRAARARLVELVSNTGELTAEEDAELDALAEARNMRKRSTRRAEKRRAKWLAKHGEPTTEADREAYLQRQLFGGKKARRRAAKAVVVEERPAIVHAAPPRATKTPEESLPPATPAKATAPRRRQRAGVVGFMYPLGANPALYDHDEE